MLEFVFNSFVTLLVVVDPLGLALIFAALTRGYQEKRKREVAIRGTILGAAILLLFALAGDVLLEALGIGIPAFRIAGGVLLFLLSLDMIFASPTGLRSRTLREQEEISYEHDVSVFPLAIPLLAGPGAITTVLLYTAANGAPRSWRCSWPCYSRSCCSPWSPSSSLPTPCISSARPVLTSSPACSACCSRLWQSSSSSTA
jgi:multiple antibiotic resistance protein